MAFITIGISYVLPFEQLDIFRQLPPVNLLFGSISFMAGIILIIDTFGQLPDVGSHQIASIGAIMTLFVGVTSFIFAIKVKVHHDNVILGNRKIGKGEYIVKSFF